MGSQDTPQCGKERDRQRGSTKTGRGIGVGAPLTKDPSEHSPAARPERQLPSPPPRTTPSQLGPPLPTPKLSPVSANDSAHLPISEFLLVILPVRHPSN